MTPLSTLPQRAVTYVRHGGPARILTAGAALLVMIGLVAASTDHFRLAIAMILLVQAVLVSLGMLTRRRIAASEAAVLDRIDQSDTRVLTDLSRARQALLTATDESRETSSR